MRTCKCGKPANGLDDIHCQECWEDICANSFWQSADEIELRYQQRMQQIFILAPALLASIVAVVLGDYLSNRPLEIAGTVGAIATLVRSIQSKQAEWQKLFSYSIDSDQWNHEIDAIRQKIEDSQKQLNEALNAVTG